MSTSNFFSHLTATFDASGPNKALDKEHRTLGSYLLSGQINFLFKDPVLETEDGDDLGDPVSPAVFRQKGTLSNKPLPGDDLWDEEVKAAVDELHTTWKDHTIPAVKAFEEKRQHVRRVLRKAHAKRPYDKYHHPAKHATYIEDKLAQLEEQIEKLEAEKKKLSQPS